MQAVFSERILRAQAGSQEDMLFLDVYKRQAHGSHAFYVLVRYGSRHKIFVNPVALSDEICLHR